MISRDKVTEIVCIIDEFCKFFEAENADKLLITSDVRRRRGRSASMLDSEIMTILTWVRRKKSVKKVVGMEYF